MGVRVRQKTGSKEMYVIVDSCGRRFSKKIGTAPMPKRDQDKIQRHYEKQLALGEICFDHNCPAPSESKSKTPLFGDFCKTFLEFAKQTLKFNTWRGYESIIALHLSCWNNRKLDSIKVRDVETLLLEKQSQGLTVNNLRICVSAIFQRAVKLELLESNPVHKLQKGFGKNHSQKKILTLDKSQVKLFLDAAQNRSKKMGGKIVSYPFFALLFHTGLRLGEALALAWGDVDWTTKQLCVRRSYSHKNWDTPKSGKTRYIDLNDFLFELLKVWKTNGMVECKLVGAPKGLNLIFHGKSGNPLNGDAIRIKFKKYLMKAGLATMTLHSCRHSFATNLLNAGAPMAYVSRMLGHSTISTTVDLYYQLQSGVNQKEMINKLL